MAYLQLAEDNPYTRLAEDNTMGNYLFIPSGTLGMSSDTYVRSDFFDSLPDDEFKATMLILAPYQSTGMNEGLVTDAVGAIPVFGGVAKFGLSLVDKIAKSRKEKQNAGVPVKPIFKNKPGGLIDKIKGAVSKNKTTPDVTDELTKKLPIVELDGSIGSTGFNINTNKESFLTKYKTPLLIGGGLLVAFVGYKLVTKKNK